MGLLGDVLSGVSGLLNTANGIVSRASSLAAASITDVVQSLPKSPGSFTNITSAMQQVSSLTNIVKGGTSQSLSKIKSLLGSSGEAINNPISFTTKNLKDTVDGFTSTKDQAGGSSGAGGGVENYSSAQLAVIASRANEGSSISNDSELDEALITIANKVSTNKANAISTLNKAVVNEEFEAKGVSQHLQRGIQDNTLLVPNNVSGTSSKISESSIKVNGADALLLTGTTNDDNNLIITSNEMLSAEETDTISYLNKETTVTTNNKASTILSNTLGNITNSLPEMEDVENSFNKVNSISITTYPNYTNPTTGEEIVGITNNQSTLTKSDIINVTKTIKKICPDINVPSVNNYYELKATYDTALDLAVKNGMCTLVREMCANTTYYDRRSVVILRDNIPDVTRRGDILMYYTIADLIGINNLASPKSDLRILNANMKVTTSNVAAYENTLTLLGIRAESLVTSSNTYPVNAYDANKIAYMVAGGVSVIDAIISRDTRVTAQTLLIAYK